jgi:hypothetical protein
MSVRVLHLVMSMSFTESSGSDVSEVGWSMDVGDKMLPSGGTGKDNTTYVVLLSIVLLLSA